MKHTPKPSTPKATDTALTDFAIAGLGIMLVFVAMLCAVAAGVR